MARPDAAERWSGPRLPKTARDGHAPEELGDPANGAPVLRCRVCGMPDRPGNRLLAGLWVYGSLRIAVVLCERELPPFDPRSGDPLQVA